MRDDSHPRWQHSRPCRTGEVRPPHPAKLSLAMGLTPAAGCTDLKTTHTTYTKPGQMTQEFWKLWNHMPQPSELLEQERGRLASEQLGRLCTAFHTTSVNQRESVASCFRSLVGIFRPDIRKLSILEGAMFAVSKSRRCFVRFPFVFWERAHSFMGSRAGSYASRLRGQTWQV